ncbi:DUF726-domain-containing protein [Collybia nuda]|uniref:DUF726-domain-containing protein n=1 Tax=Collybia nuda TaxID=64659 RepID=A0A9P5YI92_9AGAR|nr:DUF726-domain-containing protein [Collybia nuda]
MPSSSSADISSILPPKHLTAEERAGVFQHLLSRLASYCNAAELYAQVEYALGNPERTGAQRQDQFNNEIQQWAQDLLEKAWMVCGESQGECPRLGEYTDTSTGGLFRLPKQEDLVRTLNSILFLHITTSKQYSARARTFLSEFGQLDEKSIISTLKNPVRAIGDAQEQTDVSRKAHAERGKTLRAVGMGFGALAGGVLVGVTGGLAAPLVGAGVTTLLGWFGVGGTAIGLLASGLAGSSVVCGALFGTYGARSTATMVERHTREVRDLAIVPVGNITGNETLGIRLCVSGWLSCLEDVTAPWTVYGGDDTYALRWEVDALQDLSSALVALLKSHTMKYVKAAVIKRTVLATLMHSLAPIALLKIGEIIDNPWMNAKALASKTGVVLGDLLAKNVFGKRPVTLSGYSLGSLVIFEALKYLASLPPVQTTHLIQDVYLFGTPTTTDPIVWASIRRLVSGRLVNGYSNNDYVLAVLCRASDASWNVAGLQAVDVRGVENILCEGVDGHTKWRGMIGHCLEECGASGITQMAAEISD